MFYVELVSIYVFVDLAYICTLLIRFLCISITALTADQEDADILLDAVDEYTPTDFKMQNINALLITASFLLIQIADFLWYQTWTCTYIFHSGLHHMRYVIKTFLNSKEWDIMHHRYTFGYNARDPAANNYDGIRYDKSNCVSKTFLQKSNR